MVGLVSLVLFIARNPANAADLFRHLSTGLGQVVDGVGRQFASNLSGGGR